MGKNPTRIIVIVNLSQSSGSGCWMAQHTWFVFLSLESFFSLTYFHQGKWRASREFQFLIDKSVVIAFLTSVLFKVH
jgi:hypothetical protein